MSDDQTGQKFRLTKEMVLLAVYEAVSPDSNYIGDRVHRMHIAHLSKGGKGHPPRASLILSRLNALAADGLLTKSNYTTGYYGYRWAFTSAGWSALQAIKATK